MHAEASEGERKAMAAALGVATVSVLMAAAEDAQAISAIRVAPMSPSRRTVTPRASTRPSPSNRGPSRCPPRAWRRPVSARTRQRPARAPAPPMTAPRVCPGGRGCATPTTACATTCTAARHPPRVSRARNSRVRSAPSPRRSSAGATGASQTHANPRRSQRLHRWRCGGCIERGSKRPAWRFGRAVSRGSYRIVAL